MKEAPFDTSPQSLFVAFYAAAEFGCFLELGWGLPVNTLDLYVEYRRIRCGVKCSGGYGLVAALDYFNLGQHIPTEKQEWRELAIRGGPFSPNERQGLLDYCQQDVDATRQLLAVMLAHVKVSHALIRGRYIQSVAKMERNGIPIDAGLLSDLLKHWETIKAKLIDRMDTQDLYLDGAFSEKRFEKLLAFNGIPWPRLQSGRQELTDETFRSQARIHPKIIAPYHELRSTLSRLKLSSLAIGSDGRNRTMLSPFRSDTGRNQPSTSRFVFGPSTWVRGLIKPPAGKFIAYIDWSQQELGIAAALSSDRRMMEAYSSGDPYLRFAQMAGAVPVDATKQSHPKERAAYKVCMLAVQYGMGGNALANQLGKTRYDANRLLRAHKDTFPDYWKWNERILSHGFGSGSLETVFGWRRLVLSDAKPASVGNFPAQANGAEMLRLAIIKMHEKGVQVAAPIHDAVLIEGPLEKVDEIVGTVQASMREASKIILNGFELESDVKIVKSPDRYMDEERGLSFWNNVMSLIGREDCIYPAEK